MRVLVVCYEWPGITANCGGGGRIGRVLVEGLRAAGQTVRVVTDPDDGHYATFPMRRHTAIKNAAWEFDPDVIHGLFSVPSSVNLPSLADAIDVPLIVTAMGADVYDPTRFNWLRPVIDAFNRHVFRGADRVIAPSTDLRDRLPADHRERAVRIPYGIDPERFVNRPRPRADHWRFTTVARLVERKQHRLAIDALAELRANGFNCEYEIVGTGPLQAELAELAADRDWLTVSGYIEDLQPVFDRSDVFLLPAEHEAFGISYLEALAAGLPVVMTPGGQTDIITAVDGPERAGVIAETDNKTAVVDAIETLLAAYPRYQTNTAGYVARHFNRADMVSDYADVYDFVSKVREPVSA